MKKQKLAIITTWYPPINGSFVQQQAEALSEHYEVYVFVAYPSILPKTEVSQERGVTIHRYHFPYLPKRTTVTMKYWISAFANKILKDIGKVDIIHAHNYLGGFVANEVSKRLCKDFFITLHNTNLIDCSHPETISAFLESSLENAKQVICVGKGLQDSVVNHYGVANTSVIGNMVDTTHYQMKDIPNVPFRFIVIADFEARKGVKEIVDAFVALDNDHTELLFIGEEDSYHLRYILSKENKRITSLGKTDIYEIPIYLGDSHCLISFSTVETFGITVVEAMSAGRPILYCASGGPEYIVPEWAGIKVDRTVTALKEGMETMINTHEKYNPQRLRDYAVKNFSKELIVNQLIESYNTSSPHSQSTS